MNPENDRFYLKAFYGLLLFHFLIWFSLGMVFDLHPDTADHWVWSRYLSWGYYEHPPMVAWAIRFFTILLGNTQWAVEICAQVITLLSFLGLFLLAQEMFGTKVAFFSLLTLEATPLFSAGSMILHINNVCVLFYIWAALAFLKGFEQGEKKYYYFTGMALGLSLMSKVSAIFFPFAVLLFLLVSQERRKLFRSIHLYFALLLALVIFSPFIYWNMNHGWISFKAQLEKGLIFGSGDWNSVLGFWFGQPVLLGPVLLIFFLMGLWSGIKKFKQDHQFAYLVLLTVVPILVFGLAAFRGKYSDPVWADIGWPFGAILVGKYFSDWLSKVSLKKGILVGGLVFLIGWLPIGLVAVHAFYPFIDLGNLGDRTLEMRGWRELGEAVGKEYQHYFPSQKKVYLLSDDYQLASAVSFYTPQQPIPYSFGKSKRNIWVTVEEIKQNGALLVCPPETCERDQEKTRILFEKIEFVSEVPIYRQGQVAKKFKLYYCSN
ncbi:MAG: glycosyltransferase family 39 protein [Thermodesulfobacteriota bacterium]|jgi:4-amino-4-deoxy-L-arabinose transferase-like glycosyltransferase